MQFEYLPTLQKYEHKKWVGSRACPKVICDPIKNNYTLIHASIIFILCACFQIRTILIKWADTIGSQVKSSYTLLILKKE